VRAASFSCVQPGTLCQMSIAARQVSSSLSVIGRQLVVGARKYGPVGSCGR